MRRLYLFVTIVLFLLIVSTLIQSDSTPVAHGQDATGTVIVRKETNIDGAADSFNFTSDFGNFALSDNKSQTFSNVAPGTYSITELVPPGWELSLISCSGVADAIRDGSNQLIGASFTLQSGETKDCTFSNTDHRGTITIRKQTTPDGSADSFSFSGSLGSFSLADNGVLTFNNVAPGPYSITELVPPGWELGLISCSGAADAIRDGSNQLIGTSFTLQNGEDKDCTFSNTDRRGTITIRKQTTPDGSADVFNFSGSGVLGSFSLADNGVLTFNNLAPGPYSITELVPAGWELSLISCSGVADAIRDGSNRLVGASFTLQNGEAKDCTFSNTDRRGTITIRKQTTPDGAADSFSFSGSGTLGSFSLADNGVLTFNNLAPGPYSITELVPAGWELSLISCSGVADAIRDGSNQLIGTSFTLQNGEDKDCTFSNTDHRGSITIHKQTTPDGATDAFNFSGSLGSFSLADNGVATFNNVAPGPYSITELVPAGWELGLISCSGVADAIRNSSNQLIGTSFTLQNGEDKDCTFSNTAANKPPSAAAGGPYSVNEGSTVTLTGSGSDPDGDALTYAWDLNNDGVFETPGQNVVFAGADGPASQPVKLQVCDTHAQCATSSTTVQVNNVPPTANAGADQEKPRNTTVTLTGTFTDPAGTLDAPYTWKWDLNGDGTYDVSGTASYGTSITKTTSFAAPGTYTLSFNVTDNDGGTHTDTVIIKVTNKPPVCTAAQPSTASIWSPQHKYVNGIYVRGVTDPEGDRVTIKVNSIYQDEPTNNTGDGDTSPDAVIKGANLFSLRAERSGTGNGRVYTISFTATDAYGAACSGTVTVGVPLSKNGAPAVNGGAIYDSTRR